MLWSMVTESFILLHLEIWSGWLFFLQEMSAQDHFLLLRRRSQSVILHFDLQRNLQSPLPQLKRGEFWLIWELTPPHLLTLEILQARC